jgi:hypothetical protein
MITNFQNHGDDDDDDNDESDERLGDEGSVLTIQDLLATDPSIILRVKNGFMNDVYVYKYGIDTYPYACRILSLDVSKFA